jgi:hypothetical protein
MTSLFFLNAPNYLSVTAQNLLSFRSLIFVDLLQGGGFS